jgi:hypothetical protein
VVLFRPPLHSRAPLPTWAALTADKAALWRNPKWAQGVAVVALDGATARGGLPLPIKLQVGVCVGGCVGGGGGGQGAGVGGGDAQAPPAGP